jgi:hypothetical protein
VPDCGVREEARHSRAGLLIMPSLQDSSVSDFRPPALPCRAIDYAVPTGLLGLRFQSPGTPVPGY